jgi:recA bacterial DNA recombination protein
MSSAVVSTSAALGRPFVFDGEAGSEVRSLSSTRHDCRASLDRTAEGGRPHMSFQILESPQGRQESSIARLLQSTIKNQQSKIPPAGVTPASHLNIRPAPEMASSGISAIDALAGGLPRGCLTEICGPASSGRTTVLLAALAAATRRGEFGVLVDASDALDPHSVAAAGVELDRLLWIRCGDGSPQKSHTKEKSSQAAFRFVQEGSRKDENRLEQLLRATDMLLESGGFGLIVLDLCDLPLQAARRIPLTTWFRYRRAVEHTPTVLLAVEQHPIAGSCSSLLLKLGSESDRRLPIPAEPAPEGRKKNCLNDQTALDFPYPAHAQLLTGLEITVELIRSRLERKPTRSTSAAFAGKTAWAG